MSAVLQIGRSWPLGASMVDGGVNFSVFSRAASGIELLFFDRPEDERPARVVRIDPVTNRTYHYWHAFVPRVQPGQLYGYRVEGPTVPERGLRFDYSKVLLDPYGRGVVVPLNYDREAAKRAGSNNASAMKSIVVDLAVYDWEGDAPLCLSSARTIIYEMHVRGFTRHASSGLCEKKPRHLCRLGRKDSVSPKARHYRSGTVAGVSIRCSGLPAGKGQLLGLRSDFLFRAAPGI